MKYEDENIVEIATRLAKVCQTIRDFADKGERMKNTMSRKQMVDFMNSSDGLLKEREELLSALNGKGINSSPEDIVKAYKIIEPYFSTK